MQELTGPNESAVHVLHHTDLCPLSNNKWILTDMKLVAQCARHTISQPLKGALAMQQTRKFQTNKCTDRNMTGELHVCLGRPRRKSAKLTSIKGTKQNNCIAIRRLFCFAFRSSHAWTIGIQDNLPTVPHSSLCDTSPPCKNTELGTCAFSMKHLESRNETKPKKN